MTGPDRRPPAHGNRVATRILRVLSPARAAIGAARLTLPALSLPGINASRLGGGGRKVVRVLGARQLAQAALTGRTPTPAVLWLGAEADAAHVATMVGVAVYSRRYRRAALGDAVVSGTLAAAGAWAARNAPAPPVASTRQRVWRDQLAERLASLVVPGYPPVEKGQRKPEPGSGTIIGSDAGGR